MRLGAVGHLLRLGACLVKWKLLRADLIEHSQYKHRQWRVAHVVQWYERLVVDRLKHDALRYRSVTRKSQQQINPLECTDNYSATSNNMKLVHWPLMCGLLHLVRRGGDWRAASPPSLLLTVPNVTAHPSTASVPITVLLYSDPLPCGFNVPLKG